MAKGINFIIPLVVYPFDVMVSINQSDAQLERRLAEYDLMDSDNLHRYPSETSIGRAVLFPGNLSLIRLREVPETPAGHGHLHHEIFHCVTFIMHRIGMQFIVEKSGEAYAYLVGYLTEQIHQRLFIYP